MKKTKKNGYKSAKHLKLGDKFYVTGTMYIITKLSLNRANGVVITGYPTDMSSSANLQERRRLEAMIILDRNAKVYVLQK